MKYATIYNRGQTRLEVLPAVSNSNLPQIPPYSLSLPLSPPYSAQPDCCSYFTLLVEMRQIRILHYYWSDGQDIQVVLSVRNKGKIMINKFQ